MIDLPHSLIEEDDLPTMIQKAIGLRPVSITVLDGGMTGNVHRATFTGEQDLVVKHYPDIGARLDIEGDMLRELRTPDIIRVPDVFFASRHLLIQEYIRGEHLQLSAQGEAGRLIALLHGVTSSEAGLGGTTLNGFIEIPSPWTTSWIAFYREHRLRFAAEAARERGQLPAHFFDRAQQLATMLDDILIEPDVCSLLHGDIWAANVLSQNDEITGFIDPSTCYGDPELELAYASLFGRFEHPFFDAYESIRPISPGFRETRQYVYGAYPALMHVLYFGDRYIPLLDEILTRSGV